MCGDCDKKRKKSYEKDIVGGNKVSETKYHNKKHYDESKTEKSYGKKASGNCIILSTSSVEGCYKPGKYIEFEDAISSSNNKYGIVTDGKGITFQNGGMYRFCLEGICIAGSPCDIILEMDKTSSSNKIYSVLSISNTGAFSSSTMLSIKSHSVVKVKVCEKNSFSFCKGGKIKLQIYKCDE